MFEKYIHDTFDFFLNYDMNLLLDKEIENTVEDLKSGNYTIMEIANILRNESRARKDWICLAFSNTELRYQIEMAMRILDAEMIDAFKESINNGTYKEYLSNIDLKDKEKIYDYFGVDMEKLGLFTKEERLKYRDIIRKEFSDVLEAKEESIEKRISWTPRKKTWYMLKEFGSIIKNTYNNYNISKDDASPKKIRKISKDE